MYNAVSKLFNRNGCNGAKITDKPQRRRMMLAISEEVRFQLSLESFKWQTAVAESWWPTVAHCRPTKTH